MKTMLPFLVAILVFVLSSCSGTKQNHELGQGDRTIIAGMILDYQNAWLANDSAKILNLFADTASIVPSGMRPIHGKKSIVQFWWPNDGSITVINNYKISVLEPAKPINFWSIFLNKKNYGTVLETMAADTENTVIN